MLGLIFGALVLMHLPLLHLPYFWDEAGYYVPAAYDIYKDAAFVPHSTLSNAHPPLVMAYLALAWKIFGYSPGITHCSMLLVSAFGLLGVFRLTELVSNKKIAVATVMCTALYPVWFAQSALAQVDLAAAAFIMWGLWAYLRRHALATGVFFTLAALAKETAIIEALAIVAWEGLQRVRSKGQMETGNRKLETALIVPLLPLALWFLYHHHRPGYFFGNPEFFRYNVTASLAPVRVFFAALRRAWQLLGHM